MQAHLGRHGQVLRLESGRSAAEGGPLAAHEALGDDAESQGGHHKPEVVLQAVHRLVQHVHRRHGLHPRQIPDHVRTVCVDPAGVVAVLHHGQHRQVHPGELREPLGRHRQDLHEEEGPRIGRERRAPHLAQDEQLHEQLRQLNLV